MSQGPKPSQKINAIFWIYLVIFQTIVIFIFSIGCLIELKFCEVSRNSFSNRCWKCQFSILKIFSDGFVHENKENGIPFWKFFHMASEAHKIKVFLSLGFLSKNSYQITTFLPSDIYREVIVYFHIPCRSFDWLKKARVNWVSREPRMASKRVPHTICKNGEREGICNSSAIIWKSDNKIISNEV